LGGSARGDPQGSEGVSDILAVAVSSSGNVVVAGATDTSDFPTTLGVVQPSYSNPSAGTFGRRTDGFLTVLNAQGTALVFSTYLGGTAADAVRALALDAQGDLWLTGSTDSTDFLGTPSTTPFTGSFLAEMAPDGTRLLQSQRYPDGAVGQAISLARDGAMWTLGPTGSVLRFPPGRFGSGVIGVANSAGTSLTNAIAPFELVSLYGATLGPTPGLGALVDTDHRIATQLAGVQVLFNGTPAPLLYVGTSQINAIVHTSTSSGKTSVEVITPDLTSTFELQLTPAAPQVFRTNGSAAVALNQDGTVNSPQTPAAPGSMVIVYASGAGLIRGLPYGSIVTGHGPYFFDAPVSVLASNRSIEVDYADPAIGFPAGVLQVDVRLPLQFTQPFYLMIGDVISEPFTLAVSQP